MPKIQQIVKDFFGKEPHKGVNPDEVVAVGAALQGGVLAGDVKDLLLLDVTPLSLGVETLGGVMTRLIERNTTIPVKKSEVFSTAADGRRRSRSRSSRASARWRGTTRCSGLLPRRDPPCPARHAADRGDVRHRRERNPPRHREGPRHRAKEQKITITSSSGLAKDEVEKAVKEAQSHSSEDKKKREAVEAKNQLDSLVYATEKLLAENADKVPAEDKTAIEAAVADAKKVLETQADDAEALRKSAQEVQKASYKVAEALYKTAPAPDPGAPAGASTAGSGKSADDVIDAEVVDEKK
jgi:Molecular chaperone